MAAETNPNPMMNATTLTGYLEVKARLLIASPPVDPALKEIGWSAGGHRFVVGYFSPGLKKNHKTMASSVFVFHTGTTILAWRQGHASRELL